MTYSSALSWRRWLLGATALTAATLVSLSSETHALTVCEDFDGVPEQLDGIPPVGSPYGNFSGIGPFGETVTTFVLPGGMFYDEYGSTIVEDVDVSVKLHHARTEDLAIWLRHTVDDDGDLDIMTVPLFISGGCSPTDYDSSTVFNQDITLYFDAGQVASIDFACERSIPSISGRYSTTAKGIEDFYVSDLFDAEDSNTLDAFNGRSIFGSEGTSSSWELVVIDYGDTIDAGSLDEWCLIFNDQEEGDIAPREETSSISPAQSGNGAITISDHVGTALFLLGYMSTDFREVERMVLNLAELAGLPTPDASGFVNGADAGGYTGPIEIFFNDDLYENIRRGSGLEYALLDTAPGSSGGDGLFTVADWVQTTRYAAGAGFDDPVKAGGPLAPSDRIVSLGNTIVPRGKEVAIPVYLQSKGVEHEIAFGLGFDPTLLRFERAERGPCLPGNADFQLTNESNANADGVFGLQVGLLPDQTFLCDYRKSPDVLANGETEIDRVQFSSRGTAPFSLLYDVSTEFDQAAFDAQFPDPNSATPGVLPGDVPNNPIVTVNVFANRGEGNEVDDPIQDFRFDFSYSSDRLEPIPGSLVFDDDFGTPDSTSFNWAPGVIDQFTGSGMISAASAASGFVDSSLNGPLFSVQFRVIVADVNPLSPFFQPSTNEPWFQLHKGSRTAINASIVGDNSPLYRARFFSADTTPIQRPPIVRLVDENGNSVEGLPASGEQITLYFSVQNNLRTVTSYNYKLTYRQLPWLRFVDAVNVGTNFNVAPDATASLLESATYFVGASDSQSDFLNGQLTELLFEADTAPSPPGGQIRVSAGDNNFFTSGENPVRSIGVINYQYSSTKESQFASVMEVLELEAAEGAAAEEKTAQAGPALSTSILGITPGAGDELALRAGVSLSNNSEPVDRFALLVTYDSDILALNGMAGDFNPVAMSVADPVPADDPDTASVDENLEYFESLVPGSFSGVVEEYAEHLRQAHAYYYDVYVKKLDEDQDNPAPLQGQDERANYSTLVVAGLRSAGAPAFTTGRLFETNFTIDGTRDIVNAASMYISTIPPVNERVEVAKLYFTALQGEGAVVTPLEFQLDPVFFIAPTVRNVAGVPVYASFADAGVTIIDNGDRRPAVRVRDTVLGSDTEGTLQIILESVGVENAAGFTLEFDKDLLSIITASPGCDIRSDGFFYTYPNIHDIEKANATGELGILTSLQPGGAFEEGERAIVNLRVKPKVVSATQQTTTVALTPLHDRAEVVDPRAIPVVSDFPESVVSVAGDDCKYVLDPIAVDVPFPTIGGSGEFSVEFEDGDPGSGCPWTAITTACWIEIRSGVSGIGVGKVEYDVVPNSGEFREGTIEVAGKEYTVYQEGCDFSLLPESQVFASPGGTGSFEIQTAESCPWDASSDNSWITITSRGFGTGPGIVEFEVDRNVGLPRTGTITVDMADKRHLFTVVQEICRYSIENTETGVPELERDVNRDGGVFNFTLVTSLGSGGGMDACPWTATTEENWITIQPEFAEGQGDAIIEFTVAPNAGPLRSGSIFVADLEYTITQTGDDDCDYTIEPERKAFTALGGLGEFSVSTNETCPWTATTRQEWITITSDPDGIGSGMVAYEVAANEGTMRVGEITVGGQTHEVQQFAGNEYVFEFRSGPEGWSFGTIDPPFTPPAGDWDPGVPAQPGSLDMTTGDNTNTFGYWRSPVLPKLKLIPPGEEEPLLEVTFDVSTDVDQKDAPEFRMRVSPPDFEKSDVFVANSIGSGRFAPTASGRTYKQVVSLPERAADFYAYFDVLNFDPMQAVADATVSLERIRISVIDPARLSDPVLEKRYLLTSDADAADWSAEEAAPLVRPVFSKSDRGLVIASGYTSEPNVPTVFGFWQTNSGVKMKEGRLYRLRFTISARPETALPVRKRLVPTFRMRMNSGGNENAAYLNIESVSDDARIPTMLQRESYDLWVYPAKELANSDIRLAFDYLFTPNPVGVSPESAAYNDPSISLVLEIVEITSYALLDEAATPAPTPAP